MTWSFHCIQRPLFTKEPSFSIQWVAGSMKTSVSMFAGFSPGARQNSELVVGRGSMTTSHFMLDSACRTWFESGPMLVAVIPERISPSILPLSAWSKMEIQDAFPAGLGRKWKPKSFSFVAWSPYQVFSRLTMNLFQLVPKKFQELGCDFFGAVLS